MFGDVGAIWCVVLFVASVFGGLVGSLSGGAGMITMPLLLLSGINPLQALATNKLQACFGSFTGAAHYYKQGLVDMGRSRACILIAVVFSAVGTGVAQIISADMLGRILPFAMMLLGAYFLLSPAVSDEDRACKPRALLYSSCAVASLYGGFIGVGIGSFILAMLVGLAGYGLSKALAHSRWIVFSINLTSTALFILGGQILWGLGILMCVGQMIGASLGAKLAIKHGARLIRPVVICLCFGISLQLLWRAF